MNAQPTFIGEAVLAIKGLGKRFTLHNQGGIELAVLGDIQLTVHAGECVVLSGQSGCGKSTLLRLIYGNYRGQRGSIRVRCQGAWTEVVDADPRTILALRRRTIGYVSQFPRAVPRVPAVDVVAEPLLASGVPIADAREQASRLLAKLDISPRLWNLAPATFSGGEQQRINIARGFAVDFPILMLDEPTASLDAMNRGRVVALIREALSRGVAVLGVFHDREVRESLGARTFELPAIEATT